VAGWGGEGEHNKQNSLGGLTTRSRVQSTEKRTSPFQVRVSDAARQRVSLEGTREAGLAGRLYVLMDSQASVAG